MDYEVFKSKIEALIHNAGNIKVRYSKDDDNHTYSAKCSDGTEIIGSALTLRVIVKFGSDHQALASI